MALVKRQSTSFIEAGTNEVPKRGMRKAAINITKDQNRHQKEEGGEIKSRESDKEQDREWLLLFLSFLLSIAL
jgi:hypothetical protein